jgi:hypothetical protein
MTVLPADAVPPATAHIVVRKEHSQLVLEWSERSPR